MKRLLIYLIIAAGSLVHDAYGQEDHYKKNVYKFYDLLYEVKPNTIEAFEPLFGSYGWELEEFYLYEQCTAERSEAECLQTMNIALNYESDNYPSLILQDLIKERNRLTGELTLEEVRKCIAASKLIDTGSPGGVYLDLKLTNNTTIYFGINKYLDEEPTIGVYLPNGKNILSLLEGLSDVVGDYSVSGLGLINDPDGYTNLRDSTATNYPVVQKLFENQLFRYWPTSERTWWKVKTLDSCNIGYMHKSRIKPFNLLEGEVSEDLKKQAERAYDPGAPCR